MVPQRCDAIAVEWMWKDFFPILFLYSSRYAASEVRRSVATLKDERSFKTFIARIFLLKTFALSFYPASTQAVFRAYTEASGEFPQQGFDP